MFIIYHYLRLKCKIFCKSLAFFLKILYLKIFCKSLAFFLKILYLCSYK